MAALVFTVPGLFVRNSLNSPYTCFCPVVHPCVQSQLLQPPNPESGMNVFILGAAAADCLAHRLDRSGLLFCQGFCAHACFDLSSGAFQEQNYATQNRVFFFALLFIRSIHQHRFFCRHLKNKNTRQTQAVNGRRALSSELLSLRPPPSLNSRCFAAFCTASVSLRRVRHFFLDYFFPRVLIFSKLSALKKKDKSTAKLAPRSKQQG